MYNFECAVLVTQIAWRIIERYIIIIIILKPACTWSQCSGVYAYIHTRIELKSRQTRSWLGVIGQALAQHLNNI